MNVNIVFCRALLALVMPEVRKATTAKERKDAWVWKYHGDHWEFHGPNNYYWHGSADNAYDARAKGWSAWLERGPATKVKPDDEPEHDGFELLSDRHA
jgi:hypothetical protein